MKDKRRRRRYKHEDVTRMGMIGVVICKGVIEKDESAAKTKKRLIRIWCKRYRR